MPQYLAVAGDIASASKFRDVVGGFDILTNDISVTASTIAQDCPGLAVPVDPYGVYAIEGYIAYNTGVDPELRIGLSAPPDTYGHWSMLSVPDGTNASTGSLIAVRREAFNLGVEVTTEAGVGGSGGIMAAPLVGFAYTFRFGGVIQLRFAQLISNAAATTMNAGSWLRVQKMN